jgi:predicted nucleic acid-binding protein
MTSERFSLDTNILVYAADRRAGERHERALEILDRAVQRDCVLTLQALAEFFHAATRKGIVPREEATIQVRDWSIEFSVTSADLEALRAALALAAGEVLSFWDALLLVTAGRAGCTFLLSEDMQDGAWFAGVTVLNPFVGETLPEPVAALLG